MVSSGNYEGGKLPNDCSLKRTLVLEGVPARLPGQRFGYEPRSRTAFLVHVSPGLDRAGMMPLVKAFGGVPVWVMTSTNAQFERSIMRVYT
jgi:hypothetical protein